MKARLTYSRNVFIPVTRFCRNRCLYCSFRSDEGGIIGRSEAIDLMDRGAEAGCAEALFCMGERPWDVPGFERDGEAMLDYLIELCELALERGLLPHTNAGILTQAEMKRLAPYNASMGLMLETTAKLEAHRLSPGKIPKVRIETLSTAGRLKIPFTTGILVGIGESRDDRIESLWTIASLHRAYDHIQEVIIQPFDPKPGTPMVSTRPPGDDELADAVRLARAALPRTVAVQVPPNLADPRPLVEAGADDLGGISPLTPDWINPDKRWPTVEELRRRFRDRDLRERLPVYPRYIERGWYGGRTGDLVRRLADPDGLRDGS